jgi:hypothetical protein
MCRSDSPEATAATCGTGSGPGGNGWVSGWIVFHDKNNNGDRNYNADAILDDTVLRVQSPITAMDSIVELAVRPLPSWFLPELEAAKPDFRNIHPVWWWRVCQ